MARVASSKKAPLSGAFLLWLLFMVGILPQPLRAGDCALPADAEQADVKWVIDGDTLQLRDGRHIRLIGLDTPELGRHGEQDMPGARAAKAGLRRLVRQGGNRVYLQPGRQPRDRYHRWLAHLYTPHGENLTQALLRAGLGRQIAVPPNLTNLDCYISAEDEARRHGLGLWRTAVLDAASLQGDERGFHLLQGRIVRVGRSRSALWLNLDGGLAIRITWREWAGFSLPKPESLQGRRLEFRGWLYRKNDEQRVRVRHPSAIRWLSTDR
jgi:micrococcal nuclease